MGRKGEPKTGGRRKGTPNRVTREIKEMVVGALEAARGGSGQAFFEKLKADDPSAFVLMVRHITPRAVAEAKKVGVTELEILERDFSERPKARGTA